jgi:hypothetical protein
VLKQQESDNDGDVSMPANNTAAAAAAAARFHVWLPDLKLTHGDQWCAATLSRRDYQTDLFPGVVFFCIFLV